MNKNITKIIFCIAVVLIVAAILDNLEQRNLNKKLVKQLEIEKKESQTKIDSIKNKMEFDYISYISTLESYESEIDSLKNRYYESIKQITKAQGNIDAYLNSTDSVRFAKFKELLTQVD